MSKLTWEEPPAQPRKPAGKYRVANKQALMLAERIGQWASLAPDNAESDIYESYWSAHDRASRIRNGKVLGFRNVGTFETMVRQVDGGFKLFARCTYAKAAFKEGMLGYNVNREES